MCICKADEDDAPEISVGVGLRSRLAEGETDYYCSAHLIDLILSQDCCFVLFMLVVG
jgi:hypothetical protein